MDCGKFLGGKLLSLERKLVYCLSPLMFKLHCNEPSFKLSCLKSLGGFNDFALETEEDCIEQKNHGDV